MTIFPDCWIVYFMITVWLKTSETLENRSKTKNLEGHNGPILLPLVPFFICQGVFFFQKPKIVEDKGQHLPLISEAHPKNGQYCSNNFLNNSKNHRTMKYMP